MILVFRELSPSFLQTIAEKMLQLLHIFVCVCVWPGSLPYTPEHPLITTHSVNSGRLEKPINQYHHPTAFPCFFDAQKIY